MKRTIPLKLRLFLALIVPFFLHDGAFAQISAPTFAFTKMCAEPPPYTYPYNPATSNFNEFTVNFSFVGANTYVLQMSKDNFTTTENLTIWLRKPQRAPVVLRLEYQVILLVKVTN